LQPKRAPDRGAEHEESRNGSDGRDGGNGRKVSRAATGSARAARSARLPSYTFTPRDTNSEISERYVAGCFGAGARRAAHRGFRLGARLLRRGPGRRRGRPPGELPQDPGPAGPVRRARELSHLAVRGGAAPSGGAAAPGRAPAT